MSKMFQLYGVGQALFGVLPPPLPFQNPPTVNQTNYEIGQVVYSPPQTPTAFYLYAGAGNWVEFATNSGAILAINGTANQITASTTAGTTTLSTPATFIAPGSIAAAVGNITATNGNVVLGTAGNKIVSSSVATTTAAGANSFGTVTLVAGTATVATTAVTANSIIFLTRLVPAGTSGTGAIGMLSIGTITAGTSFVINALTTANLSTVVTNDISNIGWMIIN